MFEKIKHIIKGWYYRFRGINYELMLERMKHCDKCTEVIYLTKLEKVCSQCWCPLKSKLVVEKEECPLGKWSKC